MPNDKPPESRLIRAAGAVAWRPGSDSGAPRVLLVHRKKYDDWSLPKGKLEDDNGFVANLRITAELPDGDRGLLRLGLSEQLITERGGLDR